MISSPESHNYHPDNKSENLTEREIKAVQEVEHFPASLGDKVDLVLVWRGLKQVTEFDIPFKRWDIEKEKEPQISEQERDAIGERVTSLADVLDLEVVGGKPFYPRSIEEKGKTIPVSGVEDLRFFIGRNREVTALLAELSSQKNVDAELGRLYGIPKTALEAFVEYDQQGGLGSGKEDLFFKDEETLPVEVREQEFMAFMEFQLSKDNWQDELETAKHWAEEIKKVSPKLYNEKVEKYRNKSTQR